MGSGVGEIREVVILGRTVRWTTEGIEYEKHRKTLMNRAGLEEGSKAAAGPVVKVTCDAAMTDGGREEEEEKEL